MQDASEDAGEVGPGASFYRIESESPFGQTSSARASTTPRACGYICTGRARRYIQHLAMTAPTRRRGRSQNGFREKLVVPITPITLGRKQRRLLLSVQHGAKEFSSNIFKSQGLCYRNGRHRKWASPPSCTAYLTSIHKFLTAAMPRISYDFNLLQVNCRMSHKPTVLNH